jgi:hypothetical protein
MGGRAGQTHRKTVSEPIPIVFVRSHSPVSGNWPGIPIALRCALKWNPDGRVVFLADDKQPDEWKGIADYQPMEKYSRLKDALAKVWPFRGIKDEWFLWASLSNWLVLAEWMNHTGAEFVCVVDCDVLIFCDVTKECQYWRQFDYAACNPEGTAQAPTFIHRVPLMEFAGWLLGVYDKSVTVKNHVWSESKCCMSAFRHWRNSRPDLIVGDPCRFMHVPGGNITCWDHNMAMSWSGFDADSEGKIMRFHKGQPWCLSMEHYAFGIARFDVRFQALHMWGQFKGRMAEYVRQSEESMR